MYDQDYVTKAKVCFASTPFTMDSVMHRVMMSKEQVKKLYPQEGKMNDDRLVCEEAPRTPYPGPETQSRTMVSNCHRVLVDRVSNGFIVAIGCKRFVGTNWETVAKQLGEYWKDPIAAEKKYCK